MVERRWIDEEGNFGYEEFITIIGKTFKFIAIDDPVESEGRTTWTFIPSGPEWKHASDNDRVWPPAYIDAEYTVIEEHREPLFTAIEELNAINPYYARHTDDNGSRHKWYHGLERQRAHHVPTTQARYKHRQRYGRLL